MCRSLLFTLCSCMEFRSGCASWIVMIQVAFPFDRARTSFFDRRHNLSAKGWQTSHKSWRHLGPLGIKLDQWRTASFFAKTATKLGQRPKKEAASMFKISPRPKVWKASKMFWIVVVPHLTAMAWDPINFNFKIEPWPCYFIKEMALRLQLYVLVFLWTN